MTPENQPEKGFAKKAYGIVKGAGHTFKRATLGDIYALIDQRADEAREHREENFRYLNNRIDTQISEVRKEISDVRKEISDVRQEIGAVRQEIGSVRQEMGQINNRLDTIMQMMIDFVKGK
jgi:chromosome segregation ATPase